MGGHGRGSAVLLLMIVVLMNFQWRSVEGRTYMVGGSQGWGFISYQKFSSVKFRTGDCFVFTYPRYIHDVVQVGSFEDYTNCVVSKGAKRHTSGKDRIVLKRGWNYFICSSPGHCSTGMKLKVQAF